MSDCRGWSETSGGKSRKAKMLISPFSEARHGHDFVESIARRKVWSMFYPGQSMIYEN